VIFTIRARRSTSVRRGLRTLIASRAMSVVPAREPAGMEHEVREATSSFERMNSPLEVGSSPRDRCEKEPRRPLSPLHSSAPVCTDTGRGAAYWTRPRDGPEVLAGHPVRRARRRCERSSSPALPHPIAGGRCGEFDRAAAEVTSFARMDLAAASTPIARSPSNIPVDERAAAHLAVRPLHDGCRFATRRAEPAAAVIVSV